MLRNLFFSKAVAVLAACTVLGLSVGCKTTGTERAAQAAGSLQALRAEVQKAEGLLNGAVTSLDDLVNNPKQDLNPQYKAYSDSMDALEAQLGVVRAQAETMKARGQAYFEAWEAQSQEIKTEELKAHSDERRAKLNAHYDEVKAEMQRIADLSKPVITALKDTKTVLGLDLTPAGLKLAAPQVTKAQDAAAELKVEVEKLGKCLDDVAVILSPAAVKPAAPAPAPEPAPAPAPEPAPKT